MICTTLTQLQEHLREKLAELKSALDDHRAAVFGKPMEQWGYELSWSDRFLANSARYAVYYELVTNLHAGANSAVNRTDDELLSNAKAWLSREVVTRARLPENSSSDLKNIMARHTLTAYAEVLALVATPEHQA